MKLRSMMQRTAAATLILTLLGCSMGYNGAWLLNSKDRKAAKDYEQFVKDRQQAHAEASAQNQIRNQRIHFDGQDRADATTLARSEQIVSPSTRAATSSARPRDRRFLYGQLYAPAKTSSSPMDGLANLRRVTFATEGADFDPALDRTGKWIVYASTQHRENSDLYLKRVEGAAITQLTDDPGDDATPSFSPDGKWVAYTSHRSDNWDIYLISVEGGSPRQITNSPDDEIHPSFSPDGKQLVYCTMGSQSGQWELVIINLEGPRSPKFIGHGLFPQWSPVENKIVYQRAREKGSRYFGVWTIELVNGEAVRPTLIAASVNAAAITPSWSTDGSSIVFCTIVNPDADLQQGTTPLQSDIWMINSDGTGRTNLTHSRFANLQPVWAPDGAVYFVSNRSRGGMENIWAVRTETAVAIARAKVGAAPGTGSGPPTTETASATTPQP